MLHYRLVILALSLGLSACHNVDDLDRTNIEGKGFDQDLARYYQQFSDREAKDYDWVDADHFARKGLMLANGKNATPEDPAHWRIPRDTVGQLQEARAQLVELLDNPKVKERYPEMAAKAQFNYDCWVEEQEENWQVERIVRCRERFYEAMANIRDAMVLKAPHPHATHYQNTPKHDAQFTVFFAHDSSMLTKEAKLILNKMVEVIKADRAVEGIMINGYTDTVGTGEYNMQLSKRRAIAVRNFLEHAGLERKQMQIFAFGEHDLLVTTQDQVREPKNRRVRIDLTDGHK